MGGQVIGDELQVETLSTAKSEKLFWVVREVILGNL